MPLVASCKLYQRNDTTKKQDSACAQTAVNRSSSKPPLNQTAARPCRPYTRKAECVAKVALTIRNEPEENDENELQDFSHGRHG